MELDNTIVSNDNGPTPKSFKKKQLRALKDAIEKKTLLTSQGVKGKPIPDKDLIIHLQNACKKGKPELTFDWLKDNVIDSSDLTEIQTSLEERFGKYCYVSNTHPQAKLPCLSLKPTSSDKKNGKKYGILQIQAYTLARVVADCDSIKSLLQKIENELNDPRDRDLHICKKMCTTIGHTVLGDTLTNQCNDHCLSGVVVNNKFIVVCRCFGGPGTEQLKTNTVCCIRPGPYSSIDPIKAVLKAANS